MCIRVSPATPWPDGTVNLGVRPEHWEPATQPQGWSLSVQAVEYLGGHQLVQGHLPCQTRIEVLWEGSPRVQVGECLSLQVKAGHAHAFDVQGLRLKGAHA